MYVSIHLGFEFGVYVHICKFILPGQERPRQYTNVDIPYVEVDGWTVMNPFHFLPTGDNPHYYITNKYVVLTSRFRMMFTQIDAIINLTMHVSKF